MSVKIILREDKINKRGEAPLYIRIYVNGIITQRSLGMRVKIDLWDKNKELVMSKHPNSARFNKTLGHKRNEYMGLYLETVEGGKDLHVDKLDTIKGKPQMDFLRYGREYIAQSERKLKYGYYRRMKSSFQMFEDFNDSKTLPFNRITIPLLKRYESYLLMQSENKLNTVHSKFKVIKTIYNSAINEGLVKGDIQNPFNVHKVKLEKTSRQYLTADEVKSLESLDLKDRQLFYRDLFIFCCLSGGLRMGDLLSLMKIEVKDYVIKKKTRKSSSSVIIRIPHHVRNMYDRYSQNESKYVFPILPENFEELKEKRQSQIIASLNTQINKELKVIGKLAKIDKPMSFHIGRHTFGTLALQKGIRIEHLKEIMGHSNIRETLIYAKIINEDLIDAMKAFDE